MWLNLFPILDRGFLTPLFHEDLPYIAYPTLFFKFFPLPLPATLFVALIL